MPDQVWRVGSLEDIVERKKPVFFREIDKIFFYGYFPLKALTLEIKGTIDLPMWTGSHIRMLSDAGHGFY